MIHPSEQVSVIIMDLHQLPSSLSPQHPEGLNWTQELDRLKREILNVKIPTLPLICVITLLYQTLTRPSISRNSRREMTQIFLSRLREANFHVSFSSRFSRIGGKVSLSPLDFQDLKITSLSFLDPFLFLLSTFKILEKISLSPLDFQDFLNQHFDN